MIHGEGVLGDGGRGIVDQFKLQGRVDFEVGSFSKALGVQGGILAGKEIVRKHALNHSRSWLLSGSQPPGVAAAQKAAVEVLMDEPEHHARRVFPNRDAIPWLRYWCFNHSNYSCDVWRILCSQRPLKCDAKTRRNGWSNRVPNGCKR